MVHKILYRRNIDIFALLFLLFVYLSNHSYQADDTKMELRTIAILVLMATIVILTSAFGAYQDGIEKEKEHEFEMKKKAERDERDINNPGALVGASGAGTSYKQSAAHLDVSEKVDMPYVKEGPNAYRGKAGGYDLRDTYDSDDDDSDSDSDSESDSDGDAHHAPSSSSSPSASSSAPHRPPVPPSMSNSSDKKPGYIHDVEKYTFLDKADRSYTGPSPRADDSTSVTQKHQAGKSGYCYIGEDRGFRSCVKVEAGDKCMSGQVFSRQDICVNPTLRE